MRQLKAVFFAVCIVSCLCACALAGPANHWSKIQGQVGFKGWDKELRRLIQANAHHANNTFCVVVEEQNQDFQAHVFWQQENG